MDESVFGLTPEEGALERVKEMKIKLPLRHHMKLHSLKLIQGKGISDAITEALDMYFTEPTNDVPEVEGAVVDEAAEA